MSYLCCVLLSPRRAAGHQMSSQPHSPPTQDCLRLLWFHSWLPHIFHDCDPFCLCCMEISSQRGGTKSGCFKPTCCGLQGVSGDVFGGAAFLFPPVGIHVVTQTTRQSKPTAGVGSNHPVPHSTDPGELGYRKKKKKKAAV